MTKLSPKISIVIPLYNAEKYIQTCIDSILQQTFRDFELIVIDDKSTDGSLEIVESYQDPRIKIYRQFLNSGESDSRNLGLKISQGKYVYFMDDDDAILPNTLEIFYSAAEESQAEVVYMNSAFDTGIKDFDLHDEIKVIRRYCNNPMPRFLSTNLIDRIQDEYFDEGVYVTPWLKIQRRDFLLENQIYFPLTTRGGDVLFNLAEICFGRKMQVIDSCCYIYRSARTGNTMTSPIEKNLRQAILSIPIAIDFIQNLLKSTIITSSLPWHIQMNLQTHIVTTYFSTYVLYPYINDFPCKEFDEILQELLLNKNIMNPELIRILCNTLAVEMSKKY